MTLPYLNFLSDDELAALEFSAGPHALLALRSAPPGFVDRLRDAVRVDL